tara:strand:- start:56 stop:316 length:261 start_codon:yes stop_codon:yes gene_type:complete
MMGVPDMTVFPITDEMRIIAKYEDKLKQLNHLYDSGMLSYDEYDTLVDDFRSEEAIIEDIKRTDPFHTSFAKSVVQALTPLINPYK